MVIYNVFTSSVIKRIEAFRTTTFPTASYVDWDGHADISSLPEGDLCGPAGFGFTQGDAELNVVFSFGLSTVNDTNLFRLRAAMGQLHSQMQPTPDCKIPLYASDGTETEHWIMIKTPIMVSPISKAQVRTIQFINLLGAVDYGALTLS